MYRMYFKQALQLMKENPFFSVISILGTAVAIALIMVIVIIYQLQTANYKPEVNRERMLYITSTCSTRPHHKSTSPASILLAKECFYPLQTPETVTAVSLLNERLVTSADRTKRMKCNLRSTDAYFWQVFSFDFLCGKPFVQTDVTSGISRAVITEQVARKIFGSVDVEGKEIEIGRRLYRIAGVVKDVSPIARDSYAHVWVPYPAEELRKTKDECKDDTFGGEYTICLLARSASDFDKIKEEVVQSVKQFNSTLQESEVSIYSQPDNLFAHNHRIWDSIDIDVQKIITQYLIALLVLLMVPALNLSGLTSSRMKKRMGELGVRKAFGATRGTLIGQIVTENLLLTLIGGVMGLVFSYIGVVLLKEWFFTAWNTYDAGTEIEVSAAALLSPAIFASALVFCLVLNLLSALIPAWRAASNNIVSSLNDEY